VTENAHEAIVSRELFNAVQNVWVRKATPEKPYYKSPNTADIFARKLFCGQCGHALIRKRGGEKFYRYLCHTSIHYTKDACGGLKITETALKEDTLDMILRYEPFLAQALLSDSGTSAVGAQASGNPQNELAATQSELDRNRRYLEGLFESLVGGDISDAEYKDMKSAYESKIAALAERAKRLREEISIQAKREASLSQAHANVQKIEQVSDLTAEIIDKLVDRIQVCPNGRIGVKFSFLDEMVYNNEGGADNE